MVTTTTTFGGFPSQREFFGVTEKSTGETSFFERQSQLGKKDKTSFIGRGKFFGGREPLEVQREQREFELQRQRLEAIKTPEQIAIEEAKFEADIRLVPASFNPSFSPEVRALNNLEKGGIEGVESQLYNSLRSKSINEARALEISQRFLDKKVSDLNKEAEKLDLEQQRLQRLAYAGNLNPQILKNQIDRFKANVADYESKRLDVVQESSAFNTKVAEVNLKLKTIDRVEGTEKNKVFLDNVKILPNRGTFSTTPQPTLPTLGTFSSTPINSRFGNVDVSSTSPVRVVGAPEKIPESIVTGVFTPFNPFGEAAFQVAGEVGARVIESKVSLPSKILFGNTGGKIVAKAFGENIGRPAGEIGFSLTPFGRAASIATIKSSEDFVPVFSGVLFGVGGKSFKSGLGFLSSLPKSQAGRAFVSSGFKGAILGGEIAFFGGIAGSTFLEGAKASKEGRLKEFSRETAIEFGRFGFGFGAGEKGFDFGVKKVVEKIPREITLTSKAEIVGKFVGGKGLIVSEVKIKEGLGTVLLPQKINVKGLEFKVPEFIRSRTKQEFVFSGSSMFQDIPFEFGKKVKTQAGRFREGVFQEPNREFFESQLVGKGERPAPKIIGQLPVTGFESKILEPIGKNKKQRAPLIAVSEIIEGKKVTRFLTLTELKQKGLINNEIEIGLRLKGEGKFPEKRVGVIVEGEGFVPISGRDALGYGMGAKKRLDFDLVPSSEALKLFESSREVIVQRVLGKGKFAKQTFVYEPLLGQEKRLRGKESSILFGETSILGVKESGDFQTIVGVKAMSSVGSKAVTLTERRGVLGTIRGEEIFKDRVEIEPSKFKKIVSSFEGEKTPMFAVGKTEVFFERGKLVEGNKIVRFLNRTELKERGIPLVNFKRFVEFSGLEVTPRDLGKSIFVERRGEGFFKQGARVETIKTKEGFEIGGKVETIGDIFFVEGKKKQRVFSLTDADFKVSLDTGAFAVPFKKQLSKDKKPLVAVGKSKDSSIMLSGEKAREVSFERSLGRVDKIERGKLKDIFFPRDEISKAGTIQVQKQKVFQTGLKRIERQANREIFRGGQAATSLQFGFAREFNQTFNRQFQVSSTRGFLKQFDITVSRLVPKTIETSVSRTVSRLVPKTIETSVSRTVSRLVPKTIETSISRTIAKTIPKTIETTISRTITKTIPKTIQTTVTKTVPVTVPVFIPDIFTPPNTPPPDIPFLGLPKEDFAFVFGDRSRESFNVFVRRKKVFSQVNKKPLPKNRALNFGAKIVDQTPAASFRIKQSKKPSKESDDLFFFNAFKFRPSKRGIDTFIEKEIFRIDSAGEVRGIPIRAKELRQQQKLFGINLFGGNKNGFKFF